MPSKSRKKIKGQARKAKKAAANSKQQSNNTNTSNNIQSTLIRPDGTYVTAPSTSVCNHGQGDGCNVPSVCGQFIGTFFKSYISLDQRMDLTQTTIDKKNLAVISTIMTSLSNACDQFPEAVNNLDCRDIVKKNIICNGVSYLLRQSMGPSHLPLACAVALMCIDSYDPTRPVPQCPLAFDDRDAKVWMNHADILGGCQRSLVKYYVKRTPCNCLDELCAEIKSTTPKIATCLKCRQIKERTSMFICTGCERITYCSKACQIANVPYHKDDCKKWQSGRFSYDK
jgi:hypothetical protein